MADDELVLPTVPEPKPDDPEDVSWALSTAEAMWARGDNAEGIKWIRKAAEAASEAEDDMRALELAKAAADLAGMISRRGGTMVDASPFVPPPEPASTPTSNSPSTARSAGSAPAAPRSKPPPAMPTAATKKPPVPTANRTSPIPSAKRGGAPRPLATSGSVPPPAATAPPAASAAVTKPVPRVVPSRPPAAPKGAATPIAEKKPRRRSRENLDAEARAALGVSDTAPQRRLDLDSAAAALEARAPAFTADRPAEPPPAPPRHQADSDATMIAHVDEINAHRDRSAAEWDTSPTQDLREDELAELDKRHPIVEERETRLGAAPVEEPAPMIEAAPAVLPRKLPSRAPPAMVHDPKIQTSQAIRVVVWRDANGVHVAPAGTAVSAITIDAVLVVLDPSADLTAWLSQQR